MIGSMDCVSDLQLRHQRAGVGDPIYIPDVVRTLCETYRCRPVYTMLDERSGLPAFETRSLLGGHRLQSGPFQFYPQPVGDREYAVQSFFALAQSLGIKKAEFRILGSVPDGIGPKAGLSVWQSAVVSTLNLKSDVQETMQGMHSGLRSDLRRWERKLPTSDLRIEVGGLDQLDSWYRLLVQLYRDKHGTMTQPKTLYRRLLALGPEVAELRLAYVGPQVAGGIFLLKSAGAWEYSWSAVRREPVRCHAGTQLGVIPLLIWSAIQDAASRGVGSFGFGSSQPDNMPLREFKRHWGCSETTVWSIATGADGPSGGHALRLAEKLYSLLPLSAVERLPEVLVPWVV